VNIDITLTATFSIEYIMVERAGEGKALELVGRGKLEGLPSEMLEEAREAARAYLEFHGRGMLSIDMYEV
jgi:hypothetical protein